MGGLDPARRRCTSAPDCFTTTCSIGLHHRWCLGSHRARRIANAGVYEFGLSAPRLQSAFHRTYIAAAHRVPVLRIFTSYAPWSTRRGCASPALCVVVSSRGPIPNRTVVVVVVCFGRDVGMRKVTCSLGSRSAEQINYVHKLLDNPGQII